MASEDDQRASSSFVEDVGSALYEIGQSSEKQVMNVKEKMPWPLLLKRLANVKLLMEHLVAGYETLRSPLDGDL